MAGVRTYHLLLGVNVPAFPLGGEGPGVLGYITSLSNTFSASQQVCAPRLRRVVL